jgi:hypothetical protein
VFASVYSCPCAQWVFLACWCLPFETQSKRLSPPVPMNKCFGLQQMRLSHLWSTHRPDSGLKPFQIIAAIRWVACRRPLYFIIP